MEQSNGYTFNYNIPQFQLGYKMNNFLSLNYPSISSNGSSSNKSFRQSIMGTIGEAFERQSLLNFVDKTHQICLQMRDGKIIQVELNDKNKKYFHDTCGLATYTNTKNAFQNAL
ncbi:MAG: hypothetical protein LBV67_03395, partial [Streptococcaceae bacterium]|nr:hypothetical protein [Streptococcaceae bacterium]